MIRIAIFEESVCSKLLRRLCCEYMTFHAGLEFEIKNYNGISQMIGNLTLSDEPDICLVNTQITGWSGDKVMEKLLSGFKFFPLIMIVGSEIGRMKFDGTEIFGALLLPLKKEQFFDLLDQAIRVLEKRVLKEIYLKNGKQITEIMPFQIAYVECVRHHCHIHMADRSRHKICIGMTEAAGLLKFPGFVRIHYSCIINMRHVLRVNRNGIVMINGRSIPISENCYEKMHFMFLRFIKALQNYKEADGL